ncbi:MAG: 5-formyltetrahydrofolate cyclo-ligase [Bacilli bacterium]|nr:5-formyltetrahydrofolate cyclo-ligase [Bacilli bacterium]
MDKKETRLLIKNIIKAISHKDEKSFHIVQKLIPLLEKYHVIALYAAMKEEVNLDALILYLIKNNKIVVLPRIEENDIHFYQITSLDELVESKDNYHIREPKGDFIFNKEDIEVIVTPGLAFDKNNNRLGHGKGYYDRYLKEYKGEVIGVSFREQILEIVPHDERDVKVHRVITN